MRTAQRVFAAALAAALLALPVTIFALDDAALHQIAEIVHDIDLKDGKYGRPEAAGIERLIAGLCAANPDDDARLVQGAAIFAGLYQSFRRPGA